MTSTTASNKPSLKQTARYQAMETLTAVFQEGAYVNHVLSQTIQDQAVASRDQALYTQLVYGTIQYQIPLEALFEHMVKRPKRVKKWLKQLLLLSYYQYYYLDAIPEHAIVNEAVRIAKKRGNVSLGRFANGVLRNSFRTYPDLESFIEAKAAKEEEASSLRYSLPPYWVAYFKDRFGEEAEALMASLNQAPATAIRILDADRAEAIVQGLKEAGYHLQASPINPASYRVTKGNPANSQAFQEGLITIQDESASLAAQALQVQAGDQVLDACAAPGGKTVQLAQAVGSGGQVYAYDIQEKKLPLIEENLQRTGLRDRVQVASRDARNLGQDFAPESLDRILVDAPCSGVGLFRRKPDTRYHKQAADLTALQSIQLAILEEVTPLLKKSGLLTYSTCTITEEENQAVVTAYLDRHPEMVVEAVPLAREALERAQTATGCLEILPHYYSSDGFFIANFRKKTEGGD
ncbi:16S rRNA (cytosine(967)-C(5))-methyltransferase RsmB [Aerococcus sp. UMB8487]|uniref:16S rRNA (cytosine(967)-C(5))-methyltransferase RsmB n=1 Tax=Aerococcus sp. UMB8487 TaxID=3046346 RepID=UPI00254BC6D2|nr:16S rRNA (cytosine(967)-C(5))-methyltransferase RsmB [Aerococcus sp. UMB8487]MDK6940430.1 16S rRNA (cytosine(967)-C(5))-methyltransferase RsmB [Aerococcus sp. UMB8487]